MRNLPLVLVLLVALAPASAAQPASDRGEIAFTRYRLQNNPIWSEIWVARPDGSGVRKVSHSVSAVEDDQAQWSPDGNWIAFARCKPKTPCGVWLVRPDGRDEHRLRPACSSKTPTTVCTDDGGPSFTPDGRHVVFTYEWGRIKHTSLGDQIEHSAIARADLNGKHLTVLRQLAPDAGDLQAPRISPNGKLIVFDRYNASSVRPSGGDALFVASVQGGGPPRQLTPWRLSAGSPAWSPDGKQVLFKKFVPGASELTPGSNLYTVDVKTAGLRRVTNVGAGHYVLGGSFSPDGASIVFATDYNGTPDPLGGTFADVVTMRLGTDSPVPVTRSANLDGWPSWGA
jgi:Tol biopolymer transport system component